MPTCLVTGGAGFIGSHIVEALLARGDRVRVLDNLSTGRLENLGPERDRPELIKGDVRDEAAVSRAVAGVDYVFHLAAMVSVPLSMAEPLQAEMMNAVGTLNLLVAARQAGVRRLVLSSTCAIYGDEPTLPKTETMPIAPKSPYAISKLAAEAYCRLFYEAFGLETVVLRYFNVFGPRQDPASPYSGVISIFVDKLARGQAPLIFGDGEQTRDFVFVKDVVQANLLAATTPGAAGGLFNIGTGRPTTVNQLYEHLARLFNRPGPAEYRPFRPGDVLHSYSDPSLAAQKLGWSARVSLVEGLQQLTQSLTPGR